VDGTSGSRAGADVHGMDRALTGFRLLPGNTSRQQRRSKKPVRVCTERNYPIGVMLDDRPCSQAETSGRIGDPNDASAIVRDSYPRRKSPGLTGRPSLRRSAIRQRFKVS